MKVVVISGWSGAGKTTLIEQLVVQLKAAGARVSVVKHAHHGFDIDREGKDSWRHRAAGAYEVVVASNRRLALLREYEALDEPSPSALLAELSACDWVLVEGFKQASLPKIEVWRAATGKPVRYPEDAHTIAVATDDAGRLPHATALPVLDLNRPAAIAAFLLADPSRHEYAVPLPSVAGRAGAVGAATATAAATAAATESATAVGAASGPDAAGRGADAPARCHPPAAGG